MATEKTTTDIAKQLDSSILAVITEKQIGGFEKAYQLAKAIQDLKGLLTKDYMQPIMALQGNKLGFKTDKDKEGGYDEATVKNCLVEAVLMGLQPCGNQFNIIKGSTYPTKEGCGQLLKNIPGLKYDIVHELPRIGADKTGAAVDSNIEWTFQGVTQQKKIPIAMKIDQYASVDSILGKAERKARAWLHKTVTGYEITDGDVEDTKYKVVSSKIEPDWEELLGLYEAQKQTLSAAERKDFERIIFNKEELSYQKVFNRLKAI